VEGYGDYDLWRMYMQVETEDIPRAVAILDQMGSEMYDRGESLEFKFLYATGEPGATSIDIGGYEGLTDPDPRIALYFKSKDERTRFIQRLALEHYDDMVAMAGKREGKSRRPGASVVFDIHTGKEFRHINVLDQQGVSEDVASDDKWRDKVRGSRTIHV